MAQHQVFSHVEYPDSNSQCSSSLGEITSDIPIDAVFGISEEESSNYLNLYMYANVHIALANFLRFG